MDSFTLHDPFGAVCFCVRHDTGLLIRGWHAERFHNRSCKSASRSNARHFTKSRPGNKPGVSSLDLAAASLLGELAVTRKHARDESRRGGRSWRLSEASVAGSPTVVGAALFCAMSVETELLPPRRSPKPRHGPKR